MATSDVLGRNARGQVLVAAGGMISNPYAVNLPTFNQHRNQFYQTLSGKVRTLAIQIRALLGEDPQRVNEELDRALYVEPDEPKTNLLDSLNHPNGLLVEQITSITKEDKEAMPKEAMPGAKVAATGAAAAHHHHVGASKLDDDEEEDEEADHEEQRKLLSAAQEAAAIEAGRFAICVTCVLCRCCR